MGLFNVFDISGSALSAQSLRLNLVASNLANAETASGTREGAYRARHPVFSSVMNGYMNDGPEAKVAVMGIVESEAPAASRYMPEHPLADAKGYVYMPNVNMVEEMADMISASRSYQNNVEVMNTSKEMLLGILSLGQ